ncbi:WD40 repeat-like protein [Patellaria atrata CBS 101060]|uniref:Mitochondrial division protein 1 n=1 Tax=Patellaria atrata CBS 101060 TaxID=1346257 RepID=A0A9P4S383_9PEZI|nr:WD40 repeat-like protein [Patellaria atrata CBS 101060]
MESPNGIDRTSPKRRRLSSDSVDLVDQEREPSHPRSISPSVHDSPSCQLVERPSRSYRERDDNTRSPEQEDRSLYYQRERSRSYGSTRSRSPRSPAPEEPQRKLVEPPPPKPTQLYYKPRLVLRGHKRGIAVVKFSPDGTRVASCSADGLLKIWDAHTGKIEHTFEGHLAGISTLAWGPDSRIIASGSDDKSIRLWDTSTGKPHPIPFLGHHNYVYSIAFSPKGNILVSGAYDEAVFTWDVRTGRILKKLPAHSDPVGGVDFVRDGTLIVSCSTDGGIRIWDTSTGQCLRTLIHEDNAPVVSVRFSPNGKYVLAWTLDSCIRLWNYVEGRCVKTYQGHQNQKFSMSGSFGTYGAKGHEYAFIASGSEDGSIVLWDVSSKNVLQRLEAGTEDAPLRGHTDVVLGVDTHPTEPMLVSGSRDGTVRIWKMEEGAEMEKAKAELEIRLTVNLRDEGTLEVDTPADFADTPR